MSKLDEVADGASRRNNEAAQTRHADLRAELEQEMQELGPSVVEESLIRGLAQMTLIAVDTSFMMAECPHSEDQRTATKPLCRSCQLRAKRIRARRSSKGSLDSTTELRQQPNADINDSTFDEPIAMLTEALQSTVAITLSKVDEDFWQSVSPLPCRLRLSNLSPIARAAPRADCRSAPRRMSQIHSFVARLAHDSLDGGDPTSTAANLGRLPFLRLRSTARTTSRLLPLSIAADKSSIHSTLFGVWDTLLTLSGPQRNHMPDAVHPEALSQITHVCPLYAVPILRLPVLSQRYRIEAPFNGQLSTPMLANGSLYDVVGHLLTTTEDVEHRDDHYDNNIQATSDTCPTINYNRRDALATIFLLTSGGEVCRVVVTVRCPPAAAAAHDGISAASMQWQERLLSEAPKRELQRSVGSALSSAAREFGADCSGGSRKIVPPAIVVAEHVEFCAVERSPLATADDPWLIWTFKGDALQMGTRQAIMGSLVPFEMKYHSCLAIACHCGR